MVCKSGIAKISVDTLTNVGGILSKPNALLGFIVPGAFCLLLVLSKIDSQRHCGLIVTIILFNFTNVGIIFKKKIVI